MIVQVFHFDRDIDGFVHVADIDAPELLVDRALEYAFRRTQNIEGSWSMGETIKFDGDTIRNMDYDSSITVVQPFRTWSIGVEIGHRSSMIFDRMIVNGETYEVHVFGFRKLEI